MNSIQLLVRELAMRGLQIERNDELGYVLDVKQMMLNYFAIRHAAWFSEMSRNMPQDFQQEYRALIRVLEDVRSRYKNFKPMPLWTLQYIAFYRLVHGPNRQKASLGTAFGRFLELIGSFFSK
ncbi:hypothetical protein CAEBREN_10925 [Caenorhabditis brenneri]|uniref:DZF domain-containing protein n=1 Tax=Caenorhabditis brenneri TaxID=135651 RepID=G0NHZ7_CAEBE|nr:hypothetical protein CAEBREN_10925 [Caenorhabditis brenneri]